MHVSESPAISKASSHIPISDVLSGVARRDPVGATLCWHATGARIDIARTHPGCASCAAISRHRSPACRALPAFALRRPIDGRTAPLPEVGLIEAPLRLAHRRPGDHGASRATVAVGDVTV